MRKVKYRTGFASSRVGYPAGFSEKNIPINSQNTVDKIRVRNKSGSRYPVNFGKFFIILFEPPSGIVIDLLHWPCESAYTRSFPAAESVGISFDRYNELATGKNLLHHPDMADAVHVLIPHGKNIARHYSAYKSGRYKPAHGHASSCTASTVEMHSSGRPCTPRLARYPSGS